MKFKKVFSFVLLFILLLSFSVAKAEDIKYDIKFGTQGIIEGILIDDFETAHINADQTWQEGNVELIDGVIHLEATSLADAYGVGIPKANIDKKYQEALYLGLKLNNLSDGDVYFSIQGTTLNGPGFFMTRELEKDYYLIDDDGFSHEVVFVEQLGANGRNALILPEEFSGYILIPTEAIVAIDDWFKTIWHDEIVLLTLGMHLTNSGSPAVDAYFMHVEVDDFFIIKNELPAYVEPTPEATLEPTATLASTNTPEVTATIEIKDDVDKNGVNPLVIVLAIVGILVIVVIVVLVLQRKKKK